MNDIVKDLGLGSGILAASLTAALATVWVTGLQQGRDHYRAEAAEPRPTATVTASPPAGVHRSPHPAPSSSAPAAEGTLLAAGEPAHDNGGASGPGDVSGSGSSPESPAPSPEPPASSSRGGTSVRLPLGVLPDLGVHLTIGGNR